MPLRRELRAANLNIMQLTERDREIANLVMVRHTEKMFLLYNLETRMAELLRLRQELTGQINRQENRFTTAPAGRTRFKHLL